MSKVQNKIVAKTLTNVYDFKLILSCVTVTKTQVWMGIAFIGYIQIVTTNNYNTTAALHNLQSLHTNLFSLSALVLTDLYHRNYKSLTKSHTPNITVLQHT
jgi:hypothetical protein